VPTKRKIKKKKKKKRFRILGRWPASPVALAASPPSPYGQADPDYKLMIDHFGRYIFVKAENHNR
jgi:hypothetical protein